MVPKNIFLVSHNSNTFGTTHALVEYLKTRNCNLVYIQHPLNKSFKSSSYSEFKNGKISKNKTFNTILNNFSLVKDFLLNIHTGFKYHRKNDIYIGVNPLNAFSGILLKKLGFFQEVIYYSVDYSPKRYNNSLINNIYHKIEVFCANNADYIWNVTNRMAKLRERKPFKIKGNNLIVPNGCYIQKKLQKTNTFPKLIYVGVINKGKGIQSLIKILPLLEKKDNIEIQIIGTGLYEEEIKRIVKDKKLERNIFFLGLKSHKEVIEHLSVVKGIGFSPYTSDDSHSYYGDSLKIKEYLSCGLPVITTNVVEFTDNIIKNKCGFCFRSNDDLKNIITKILSNGEIFDQYSRNALKLAQKYEWNRIYDNTFSHFNGEK